MIFKVEEKAVEGKLNRMERHEMRSEDGMNSIQCSIFYYFGQTAKGEFTKCRFGDFLERGHEYAYFMLLNTMPEHVYSVILELDPSKENADEIVEAAEKLGFVKQKGAGKTVTYVKKM